MTRRRIIPGGMLVVALALAACGGATARQGDDGLVVVTTVSPITNLVQNVGGAHVTVTGIVPEGQNSHEFEPAPSDARLMADADIVFVNGLNLEVPSLKLAEANVREGAEIVKLGELTVAPDQYIYDFSFPKAGGDPNPHLWTNPPYAKRFAEIVKDTLARRDPANAADYERNYAALARRFDALDRAVREATATVPAENRKLLTYHDSFPYFARDYGWTVIGAIQPADFSEPSPRELARLIEQIEREKVPAIFGSEVFPSPVLKQIADETGARYVDDLRDDDLPGAPGDPGHSLLGLLVFDYRTFIEALGGDPSALDAVDTANLHAGDTVTYRE